MQPRSPIEAGVTPPYRSRGFLASLGATTLAPSALGPALNAPDAADAHLDVEVGASQSSFP